MDATTTRASTVMRSMPTRETRTHASMTIPLSRTRSRTSIRLAPPAARSTGIEGSLFQCSGPPAHLHRKPALERTHLLSQLLVFRRERLLAWREVMIVLPPVEANVLGL